MVRGVNKVILVGNVGGDPEKQKPHSKVRLESRCTGLQSPLCRGHRNGLMPDTEAEREQLNYEPLNIGCQTKSNFDALLNGFKCVRIQYANIVNAVAAFVFTRVWNSKPTPRERVDHIALGPHIGRSIWLRHWLLKVNTMVVRLNGIGLRCTQRNNSTQAITITKPWRNHNHRSAFNHLWLFKPAKVADQNRTYRGIKSNSHIKLFCSTLGDEVLHITWSKSCLQN